MCTEFIVYQKMQTHTILIHQRVIIRRPYALDRPSAQHPVKIISKGALPPTASVLKGARSPTMLLIRSIATVICEVTALPWSETPAIFTRQEARRTGP